MERELEQHILYHMQVYYLVLNNKPLFNNEIVKTKYYPEINTTLEEIKHNDIVFFNMFYKLFEPLTLNYFIDIYLASDFIKSFKVGDIITIDKIYNYYTNLFDNY